MPEQARHILERIRRQAMPGGDVACRGTWVRQEGEMRFAPDRPWLPFEAEQWFLGPGVDFRWQARVRMAPLLRARVTDSFAKGEGALTARVLGFVPVARACGPDMDRGEAQRGLAELPWRPFAFKEGQLVTWDVGEAGRLHATFDDGKTQAAVELAIDDEGRVLRASTPARPRLLGRSVVDTAWSGAFGAYRSFGQLRVPKEAEVTWQLPGGPFTYWRGRVTACRILR